MSNSSKSKSVLMILVPVIVLVGITLFSVLNRLNQASVMEENFKNPQDGDVILVQTDEQPEQYFYIRLYRVESDRIYYYQSPYFYNEIPREMKQNDGFVARAYIYDRKKFDSLKERGLFLRLIRDYPEKSRYNHFFTQEEMEY